MKKVSLMLLAGLLLIGATSQANTVSKPLAAASVTSTPYGDGFADGTQRVEELKAIYGYGTAEYEDELNAEIDVASTRARTEASLYWRGYTRALTDGY